VSFKPATPGTLDTDMAITGLQGGENVLGIDFRQTNGTSITQNGSCIGGLPPGHGLMAAASSVGLQLFILHIHIQRGNVSIE